MREHRDCLTKMTMAGGTIFPEPIGQAMSFNTTLVSLVAAAIASEAAAIGVDAVFAPVVNMMTDPVSLCSNFKTFLMSLKRKWHRSCYERQ